MAASRSVVHVEKNDHLSEEKEEHASEEEDEEVRESEPAMRCEVRARHGVARAEGHRRVYQRSEEEKGSPRRDSGPRTPLPLRSALSL